MLQKKYRLNRSKDIQKTSLRGRSFFSPFFVIKYEAVEQIGSQILPRVGLIVSNRVSKKAVERNRIRRVIRETVRLNIDKIKFGDYVIIVRPAITSLADSEIVPALLKAFKSTKLLQ